MAMHPQSPPCPLATEPAAVPNEASVTTAEPVAMELAIREQDRLMPIANVVHIMRRVLPPHAKVFDDAKEMIQECVSEFISFVTGEANERCHHEHRKTVTAEDVICAMDRLGFDDYVSPLNAYLHRMRECEGTAGTRGAAGRGDRGRLRAPPVAAALHGVQVHPAVYQHPYHPAAVQGYAAVRPIPLQVSVSGAVPHFGGQCRMLAGERAMAAYYGGLAFHAGGTNGGGCADEGSSSNEEPPATSMVQHPKYPN